MFTFLDTATGKQGTVTQDGLTIVSMPTALGTIARSSMLPSEALAWMDAAELRGQITNIRHVTA